MVVSEYLEQIADMLRKTDGSRRGPKILGVKDGKLIIIFENPSPPGFTKITKLSSLDFNYGLSSYLWDEIQSKFYDLKKKGLLI